jgi:hypothetical protein
MDFTLAASNCSLVRINVARPDSLQEDIVGYVLFTISWLQWVTHIMIIKLIIINSTFLLNQAPFRGAVSCYSQPVLTKPSAISAKYLFSLSP